MTDRVKLQAEPSSQAETRRRQLYQRRLRAVELMQQGKRTVEIAEAVGVSEQAVREWRRLYEAEGVKGLQIRKQPGRQKGSTFVRVNGKGPRKPRSDLLLLWLLLLLQSDLIIEQFGAAVPGVGVLF